MKVKASVKFIITLTGCIGVLLYLGNAYLQRDDTDLPMQRHYFNYRQRPLNSQQNSLNSKMRPLNSQQGPLNSQQGPQNSQQGPQNSQQRPQNSQQGPLLTLFTTWTTTPERYDVYNNTLRNWPSLQPSINIIVFTNDVIPDKYKLLGWTIRPVKHQVNGHPVLKYMFLEAMEIQPMSKLYGFSNGDLLFTNSLIKTLHAVVNSPMLVNNTLMLVGQRMNTPDVSKEDAGSWKNITEASKRGTLMKNTLGIDYFITTPDYHWKYIPEVQVGQKLYDNWLVFDARRTGSDVIDVTRTLLAVHQDAPYPKHHGKMNHNRDLITENPRLLYNRGVVACSNLRTIKDGQNVRFKRPKLPRHCFG
ncbi:uncharacterized protein [Argopecten irradians]|uniref:uncharacterized protein n=1 Tax=Argopecten irradians TaxID=31199 RepID=UPI003720CF05